MDARYLRIRRVVDRVVAASTLAVAAPVLAGVALAILIGMGRPVLFRQERVGEGGRVFRIAKFRTMVPDAERLGDGATPPELDLVPPLGRFLRATSLDELPQLWNVLVGDMAFIGPRPAPPAHVARYTERQLRRLDVPQGLTGLAQVRFRHSAPWSVRIETDLEYAARLSPRVDAIILLETARSVLRRRGVQDVVSNDDEDFAVPPANPSVAADGAPIC